jgi:RNA polymerase sigma-70 factor, ECF subfamily
MQTHADAEDATIIARVCAGDLAAFAVLMRRYNQRLYRAARAILRDDSEAEDVVQETYLRAFAHLSGFRYEARLGTWLTKIAVNEACARLRRSRRARVTDDIDVAGDDTPEHCAHEGELRSALETAIDRLPARLRVVFVLRALEELSTAETARILGISPVAVKVRLHRARAAIQRSLSGQFEGATAEAFMFLGLRCGRLTAAVLGRLLSPPELAPARERL